MDPLEGGGVPERMDLARGVSEERAQGPLVQGGEDDPGHGQAQVDAFDELLAPGQPDPFEKGRTSFGDLDRQVGGHMPGHQEEHRRRSQGDEHRIEQPPGLAQIHLKKDDREEIAEQAVQQRQRSMGLKSLRPKSSTVVPSMKPEADSGTMVNRPQARNSPQG